MDFDLIFGDINNSRALFYDTIEQVNQSTSELETTYSLVDTKDGFLFNRSAGMAYISDQWSAKVTDVYLCTPPVNVTPTSEVKIGSRKYKSEPPIDIGNLGELLSIGLVAIE